LIHAVTAGDIVDDSTIAYANHLTDAERIDWLRLIRSDNVGPRGIMAQTPQANSRGPHHVQTQDHSSELSTTTRKEGFPEGRTERGKGHPILRCTPISALKTDIESAEDS
jgi:hypothetical protein